MKKYFQFTILLFISAVATAQTLPQTNPTLPATWKRIYIKNVGNIDIPPTMEIQAGKYKEFNDELRKIKGYDAPQIVIQQKGLNEMGKEGFQKYARVMIETDYGSAGDYDKLNFSLTQYSQSDISQLSAQLKSQVAQSFAGTGLKLLEWYGATIEKINGMSCVHISYKRQLDDKPFVLVHMYMFQNYDRVHRLTLSYRLSEQDYWKTDYVTVLKSFRLTTIK